MRVNVTIWALCMLLVGCGEMGLTKTVEDLDDILDDGTPFGSDSESDDTGEFDDLSDGGDEGGDVGDDGGDDGPGSDGGSEGGDADDGGSDDGGSDDGGSDDGGDDGSDPSAPAFEYLAASQYDTETVEVTFRTSDDDGDLSGGTFELEVDGETDSLSIPGDIDSWSEGNNSTVYWSLEIDQCATDTLTVSGWIEDASGLSSSERNTSVVVAGDGTSGSESGDTMSSVQLLGSVGMPMVVCADIYQASNDGSSYTGDMDWYSFTPSSGGSRTFDLEWDMSSTDYDLYLLDSSGAILAWANTDTTTAYSESFTYTMTSGAAHTLVVAAWTGNTGDYVLSVQ